MKNKISLLSVVIMGSLVGGSSVMCLAYLPEESLTALPQMVDQLGIAFSSLPGVVNDLTAAIQRNEAEDAILRQNIHTYTNSIVKQTINISSLKAKIAKTKAQIDKYNKRLSKTEQDISTFEKDDTRLESRDKMLSTQMAKLKALNESLNTKIAQLDAQKKKLSTSIASETHLTKARASHIKTLQSYINSNASAPDANEAFHFQINALENTQKKALAQLLKTQAQLEQNSITLKQDSSKLESQKTTLTKDAKDLVSDSAELKYNKKGIKIDTNAADVDQKREAQAKFQNDLNLSGIVESKATISDNQGVITSDQNDLDLNAAAEKSTREIQASLIKIDNILYSSSSQNSTILEGHPSVPVQNIDRHGPAVVIHHYRETLSHPTGQTNHSKPPRTETHTGGESPDSNGVKDRANTSQKK